MGFRDKLAAYNATKPDAVPVNPPESAKVLAEQTAPEVDQTAPKAPPASAAGPVAASASPAVAPLPSTPTVEAAKVKRTRRTKAEMEALRAQQPAGSTAAPSVEESAEYSLDDYSIEEIVSELKSRGYSGSLSF